MRYEVTNLRLLEVVRSKSSFDVSFWGQTHLPFVTSTNDRSQEAHDFYPKNGCDVCALKRGWSRAAIQTVAGGTPFVKPRRREREIALRKIVSCGSSLEVSSAYRSLKFDSLSFLSSRGVKSPVSSVTYQFSLGRRGRNPSRGEETKNVVKSESTRLDNVNIFTHVSLSDSCSHIYLSFFFS